MSEVEAVGVESLDTNESTVGAVVSMTIALAPAMLLVPVGTVVDDIALPAVSRTVPIVKLDTVRSSELSEAPTVYVPVKVVPADAAVRVTVAPVSSVATTVFPERIASFAVAVMLIAAAALYEPLAVLDENEEIVGATVSTVIVVADVASLDGPVLPAVSIAPEATNLGITVPSLQPETVTVRVVPEVSVPGVNAQPVAVPVFAKSPDATPVTASPNVIVYVNDDAFVGVVCADVNEETDGPVVSMMMLLVSAMLAPDGRVVEVMALPEGSATVPTV